VLQAKVGERYPVRELLRLMIVESDNIAALVLLDRVGVEEVNGTIAALGLRDTRIQERVPDGAGGLRLAGPHVTSARDLALLLETIAAGRLVDPPTSELALELLERRQAQAWLADGLPWYAKLAHKWGDLPDARHDAGIVYTPEDAYLIVVLTRNAATPRDAAETIAAISRAVFAYFAGS
jgi:beta-lactamase class A